PELRTFQWIDFRDFGEIMHGQRHVGAGERAPGPPSRIAPFAVFAVLVVAISFLSRYAFSESFQGVRAVGIRIGLFALIVVTCVALAVFCFRMLRRKRLYHLMAEKLKERLQAEALN